MRGENKRNLKKLNSHVRERKNQLGKMLERALGTLRFCVNATTKLTPFEAHHGKETNTVLRNLMIDHITSHDRPHHKENRGGEEIENEKEDQKGNQTQKLLKFSRVLEAGLLCQRVYQKFIGSSPSAVFFLFNI